MTRAGTNHEDLFAVIQQLSDWLGATTFYLDFLEENLLFVSGEH